MEKSPGQFENSELITNVEFDYDLQRDNENISSLVINVSEAGKPEHIGFITVTFIPNERCAYLDMVNLKDEYQNKGIGGKLFDILEQQIRDPESRWFEKIDYLTLKTRNPKVINILIEKFGENLISPNPIELLQGNNLSEYGGFINVNLTKK